MPVWTAVLLMLIGGAGVVICYRLLHHNHLVFARIAAIVLTALSLLSVVYLILVALLLSGVD